MRTFLPFAAALDFRCTATGHWEVGREADSRQSGPANVGSLPEQTLGQDRFLGPRGSPHRAGWLSPRFR